MELAVICLLLFLINAYTIIPAACIFDDEKSVYCYGKTLFNVTLTAYFSDEEAEDGPYRDYHGKKLRSLQDYLDDESDFVTLAMDKRLGVPYGTRACIPELNAHYGHNIKFQVRDVGSNLLGTGFSRADVYVRSEEDSYDKIVNKRATLVFEN